MCIPREPHRGETGGNMEDDAGEDSDSRPIVLCVEDETALRADLVEELEEAGYTAVPAAGGDEAVARCGKTPPDLVLCDINMPGMNGYAVLETLRERYPELADTPFVFLTALASPREVVAGKRAGADDYLVKPIDFNLMLATIEARLREVGRIRARTQTELDAVRSALIRLSYASQQVLDRLASGVVLLDRSTKVLFANRAARVIAAKRDGLVVGDTLRADQAQASAALKDAIEKAIYAAPGRETGQTCLSLPRPSGKRELMAIVCPLPATPEAGATATPAAALFIGDPEQPPPLSPDRLCALFGLTNTEAEVAQALANGKRPADIAAERSVSSTTVAFHMRNLFQKTGVSRQADLIALILTSPLAVADDDAAEDHSAAF